MRTALGWMFLLLTLSLVAVDAQVLKYGVIRISVAQDQSQVSDNTTQEFCFTFAKNLFDLPLKPEKSYGIVDATNVILCNDSSSTTPAPVSKLENGTLLLFRREDNCSLIEYIKYTKESHAVGFLIYPYPSETINDNHDLEIFGAIGNHTLGELKKSIAEWKSELNVQFYTVDDSIFGGSIIFLWLTACFCVAIGSLTGPYQDLQSTSSRQQILEGTSSTSSEPKNVQVNFTVTLVMTLVVFITATLLLLYFFYQYLVYFFMGVFCFASGRATYEILNQIAHLMKFDACAPRIRGCGVHRIFLAILCLTLPILWFVFRHNSNIWILQDLLGICFCIHIIQTLRIPNLQICTVLLSLLFIYDVFFVFITPYFTSNGKSVMVEVATGGNSGEALPLLIKFPRSPGPEACSMQQSYSLLGFGDIIVPGFLVCFAHSFDIIRGDKIRPYFIVTMIGYVIGLAIAFVALFVSQTGQPALLYIVPCTLLAISVAGLIRKQFRELWRGSITITEVEP